MAQSRGARTESRLFAPPAPTPRKSAPSGHAADPKRSHSGRTPGTAPRLPRCPAALPRPLPLAFLALSSAFLARGAAGSAPSAPAAFFLRRLPRSQLKARRRPDAPERDFFLRGGPPGPPGSSAAGAAGDARAAIARRADLAAGVRPPEAGRPWAGGERAGGQAAAAPRRARRKVWAAEAERARSGRAAGAAQEGPRGGGRGAEAGREGRGREGAATGRGRRCLRPLPPPPARRPGSRSSGASGGRGPVPREGGHRAPEPRRGPGPRGRGRGVGVEGAVPRFSPGGAIEESKVPTEKYWRWGGGAQRKRGEKCWGWIRRELRVLSSVQKEMGDSGILFLE